MTLKKLTTIATLSLLTLSTQARFTAFDTAPAFEKEARGFTVEDLKVTMNDRYIQGADLRATIGRDGSDFRLMLQGLVLLPIKGERDRKTTQVRLGLYGLELNSERSLSVYNELAVDYTPKKIAEGVVVGDSVFKCSAPTECQLLDERGNFWLFEGDRASGEGELFRPNFHGNFKYYDIPFTGKVQNQSGRLTKAFKEAISRGVLEVGPDTIKYFQKSHSSATNQKTYEEHRRLAKEDVQKDLGKTEVERELVKDLLSGMRTRYEEKVRRGSRSGCTYFCGASGRFVEATTSAKVNF